MESPILNFPHLRLWLDEAQGLVCCDRRRVLAALDVSSAYALLGLSDGLSLSDVADELVREGGLDAKTAVSAASLASRLADPESELPPASPRSLATEIAWIPRGPETLRIRIGALRAALHVESSELSRTIREVFAPIVVHDSGPPTARWYVCAGDDGFALGDETSQRYRKLTFQQVLPLLMDELQTAAYRDEGVAFAFHAAAVHWRGRNWIFPGPSGAGKSTLAARLVAEGGACYSDEIVALDALGRIRPLPLPMTIKSGSWELTESVERASVWARRDGRLLRYAWPARFAEARAQEAPLTLVFPRFVAGGGVRRQPLGVVESLRRLAEAGYEVTANDPAQAMSWLVGLVERLPRCALEFGECADVAELLCGADA